jgi:hypothetical protein
MIISDWQGMSESRNVSLVIIIIIFLKNIIIVEEKL